MSKNIPDWLNNFILTSFGQYDIMNQHDFVQKIKDENNINQQNEFNQNFRDESEKANVKGINDQTGDTFEVVVQKSKDSKKDKGLQVEFSSGEYKNKYICSSIEDFCNGRYINLSSQPIKIVAEEIAKDKDYIINFIETSIASNLESITIENAVNVTNKIIKNSSINENDYKKICSKLNYDDLIIYKNYLSNAKISIAKEENINYFIDYIKNFKEYKLASENLSALPLLKARINSIEKFKLISGKLHEAFKNDSVLSHINLGEQ